MPQRVVQSQRWLLRQQSSLTLPELGLLEFLVLCFEQIAVAGAAMNCFQAVPENESGSKSDNTSGNAPLFLPAVARVIPQALMVIVVLSFWIVWGTQLVQGALHIVHLKCANRIKHVVRRRFLPPVIALLKLFFLLYVTLRLNDSTGLQWKQQSSALYAALILVICEVVDVFAVAHTWILSRWRGIPIHDWREQEGGNVTAKKLVLTFFDRWKECALVTSFLSQSELILLAAEIPSMAWASWTCCQRGATPEHISYQLHRWLTVLTIAMGMQVVLVEPEVEDDIVGATIFLIADVVLTALRLFEGRHRRRARREDVRMQRMTMMTAVEDIGTNYHEQSEHEYESDGSNDDAKETEVSKVTNSQIHAQIGLRPQRSTLMCSNNVLTQCWDLKRRGLWKSTVIHGVPGKECFFGCLDCIYSLLVVLNFYETVDGSELQIIRAAWSGTTTISNASSFGVGTLDEEQLMNEVNHVSIIVSSAFWSMLGLSLAGRHYFLYSSRRQQIPGVPHYFPTNTSVMNAVRKPNYFAISVEIVKWCLLPVSMCTCAYVLVKANWYVPKQGVNVLVAGAIGAIAAARSIDALSRALYGLGRFDGDPPGLVMFGGSPYVKASTSLQVFWDRFNDFLGPLSLDHLMISSTTASKNFIVVYFLFCVCVLHALIAYVDAISIKSAVYRAERLGYLVAVTFLVRNSAKYIERQGSDLYAPVLLVAIEFFVQVPALVSLWKDWVSNRKAESAERASRQMPMLSSISEPDEWPVLSSSGEKVAELSRNVKERADVLLRLQHQIRRLYISE
ncbi:unnamed protein product [Phytophthora lilii]|uniref:Unnamed protein product n=1 Tax=Phytophthora lilii TaxID=2077276 RepID=A0A9W6X6U7_9STRA|nr:unnamed protein product [Phytophthora lilii]